MRNAPMAVTLIALLTTACGTSTQPEPQIVVDLGSRPSMLEACVNGEDWVTCAKLGDDYRFGTTGPVKGDSARKVYEMACDHKVYGACMNLGTMWLRGEGGPKDLSEALRLEEKVCAEEEGLLKHQGCHNAGLVHLELADEEESHISQALLRWEGACDAEYSDSCGMIAQVYLEGTHVEASLEQAIPYLVKTCELGHARSCLYAWEAYDQGKGIPADPTKAADYKARAFALGESAACDD